MSTREARLKAEYALVGGGLQNGLLALALLAKRPDAQVLLIERDGALGGNHLWSFHAEDVPEAARPLIEPVIVARWDGYSVAYPSYERRLTSPYASISSSRFDSVVQIAFAAAPAARMLTGAAAARVTEHEVVLTDGRRIEAELVVDARGPGASDLARPLGYQKFVGLELALRDDAPPEPMLMDARVAQTDGYRFVYVLPLGPRRVLVEDTRYSDHPELDVPRLRREIIAYAVQHGMRVEAIERQERGVLPLPLGPLPLPACERGPLRAGYQGGWFHPTTGYSFPAALRLALALAELPSHAVFGPALRALAAEQQRQARFAVLLNRLLFEGFLPERRWHALERFYTLPEATIRRFYALATTRVDRARILCGRPPRGMSLRELLRSRERHGASA